MFGSYFPSSSNNQPIINGLTGLLSRGPKPSIDPNLLTLSPSRGPKKRTKSNRKVMEVEPALETIEVGDDIGKMKGSNLSFNDIKKTDPKKQMEESSLNARNAFFESETVRLQKRVKELEEEGKGMSTKINSNKIIYEESENKYKARILELETTLDQVRHDTKEKQESFQQEVRELTKKLKEVQKELEGKHKKLERAEQYLQVSKDISTNLQNDKASLSSRLDAEKAVIDRLNSLAESSKQEYERMEHELAEKAELLKSRGGLLDLAETELFLITALAIKLNRSLYAVQTQSNCHSNVSIHELFEQCKKEGIPREQWGIYIEHVFSDQQQK